MMRGKGIRIVAMENSRNRVLFAPDVVGNLLLVLHHFLEPQTCNQSRSLIALARQMLRST